MTHSTHHRPLIPGAILASGWSRRMGRSKALLPVEPAGSSFVRTLADALRDGGIADVLVVGRPDDHALQAEVATLAGGVRYVDNHHADQGQISSILAAIDVVDHPGVQGLLVVPVDLPLITAATVAALLAAFEREAPAIARPTYHGRNGHPVVFAPSLFGELRHADRSIGARAVVRAHAAGTVQVEVPDANVLVDIDDPEAYLRVFGVPLPV